MSSLSAVSGWTPGRARALRLGLVAILFGALLLVGKLTGAAHELTPDRLRALVLGAGAWGVLAYLVVFSLGQLAHLPGLLFIAAGVLAYGRLWGAGAGWIGALVSLSVTFVVVRAVGGSPLAGMEGPWVRKILARLETHPVLTVLVLRLLMTTTPALNYTLALSGIRYRHYLLGSAVGLVPIVVVTSLFLDRVLPAT
jgi:uncharacterized membrane protein YdjX (TVP38/TMEM64 family)